MGGVSEKEKSVRVVPLTLKQANALVARLHRHHKPAVGHRFSLGLMTDDENLIGVVMVGRPVSRELPQYSVAEVTRLATDGTRNACSFLYGVAARVCREMGFERIQTYILESEPGTSLRASGWKFDGMTNGGDWNNSVSRKGTRRTDQPQEPKQRWVLDLRTRRRAND